MLFYFRGHTPALGIKDADAPLRLVLRFVDTADVMIATFSLKYYRQGYSYFLTMGRLRR